MPSPNSPVTAMPTVWQNKRIKVVTREKEETAGLRRKKVSQTQRTDNTANLPANLSAFDLLNLEDYAADSSIMRKKHPVTMYNVVLDKRTGMVTGRSENHQDLRLYELSSLKQKVAYMNILQTTRHLYKYYIFRCHRLRSLRKLVGVQVVEQRKKIRKVKRCTECSLHRWNSEPNGHFQCTMIAGFSLVYIRHRGFDKRTVDRILERDIVQLVSPAKLLAYHEIWTSLFT